MNHTYEVIKTNELPIHIFLHSVKYVNKHWHDSLELLFVLKGRVTVWVHNEQYDLFEKDILLINANDVHSLQSHEDNLVVALQIPLTVLGTSTDHGNNLLFHCKSIGSSGERAEEFEYLCSLLAQMMWAYNKQDEGFVLQIQALYYQLLHLLTTQFIVKSNTMQNSSHKYMERLLRFTHFVNENYGQKISLNELSKKEYLSVPYMSKFIQTHLGMSFMQYVDTVRMEHALADLQRTDLPIIQIAMNNGFPSVKSFNRVFKEFYNMTPGEFRKEMKPDPREPKKGAQMAKYVDVDKNSAFELLFTYLPQDSGNRITKPKRISEIFEVKVSDKLKDLHHHWKRLMTVGKAKQLLFAPIQAQLIEIQKSIGFKYIRFHGIFDDDMMVYDEDDLGAASYNFTYTDMVIDFLLSIGVRPFVELGFMPSKLASASELVFYNTSNVSRPKDISRWNELVIAFVRHCGERYGWTEVASWYFEVWNEPDFLPFWRGTHQDYCNFYQSTYTTVKHLWPNLRIGGPAITSTALLKTDWLQQFLAFCKEKDCIPDFLSFHCYPHDILPTNGLYIENQAPKYEQEAEFDSYILSNENYLHDAIQHIHEIVRNMEMGQVEIHLTEWNSTAVHRDLTNDTCYKAAYIVKNIVENIDTIDSFGYWTFTDLIEEHRASAQTFHGGLGILTSNGIPKAGFLAYELLAKLGDELVAQGEGFIITRNHSGLQVLLYHYCHYDKLYSLRINTNINDINRYDVFTHQHIKDKQLHLKGLEAGEYSVEQKIVNRSSGSSFDQWVAMGTPKVLSSDDIEYLKRSSISERHYQIVSLQAEENLILHAELNPHEVRLFEIKQK